MASCQRTDNAARGNLRTGSSLTQSKLQEDDLAARRGRCVIVQGYGEGYHKTGPTLRSGTFEIGLVFANLAGEQAWASMPHGARVSIRGRVAERNDLPVFIQRPGDLLSQGIPVPEGTDLEKASHRWVIEHAKVTLLRSVARVNADLMTQVGKDVSLDGVIWSINGHYWFTHDGIDIHVQGQDAIPGWSQMHGTPATLHGHLEHRTLPRIDQLALKASPDLADAFLLSVHKVTSHPSWPIKDCAAR